MDFLCGTGKHHFHEGKHWIWHFMALTCDSNVGEDCSFLHWNAFHHVYQLATNTLHGWQDHSMSQVVQAKPVLRWLLTLNRWSSCRVCGLWDLILVPQATPSTGSLKWLQKHFHGQIHLADSKCTPTTQSQGMDRLAGLCTCTSSTQKWQLV